MLNIQVLESVDEIGQSAAKLAAGTIRAAIDSRGSATVVLATGVSQFKTLAHLTRDTSIDWSRVTAFHLDEYIGLPEAHPASFRRYLRERFVQPLGGVVGFHPISGENDPVAEARRLGELIRGREIDLCLAGIGENCHLAFNDPPADFETDEPFIVVELDEHCRRQQLGEGWFSSLAEVPKRAISMSIRQIMRSRLLVVSAPEQRKAAAVRDALTGPVTPEHPASIVQMHPAAVVLLDAESASLLDQGSR